MLEWFKNLFRSKKDQEKILELEEVILNLKSDLKEKEDYIHNLDENLKNLKDAYDRNVSDHKKKIEILQADLNNKDMEIDNLKDDEQTIKLESKVKGLNLDLEDKIEEIKNLKLEIDRIRQSENQRVNQQSDQELEELFYYLANPISQLIAMENQIKNGKEIQTQHIITLISNLIRIMEDSGAKIQGKTGLKTLYDPLIHEPMGDEYIEAGEEVVIQLVGMNYNSKIIKKALVMKI